MKKINELPLKDKTKYLSGKDTWSLPDFDSKALLRMSDGPHGLRYVYTEENGVQNSYKNVTYPSLSTLANSWSRDILFEIGKCLAQDCIEKDVDIILGPGVNLKRHPFCGRNFEYFSEDSYLSGKLASSYINGVQSKGVGACIKHYACNNRERDRFFESSEVDIRALNEEFLKPFRIAINESSPWSLMCSYNPINGIYASENKYLLKDILRDKYHYDGVVISDWGATRNRAVSLKNGVDISMPFSLNFENEINSGLLQGFLTENDVNESIERIDNLREKLEKSKKVKCMTDSVEARIEKSFEAILQSIVLLKNEENILPLIKKEEKILVVGDFAINPPIGGEGSSKVVPIDEKVSLLDELKGQLINTDFEQAYVQRYNLIQPFGCKKAILKAKIADKVIICLGTNEMLEKEETDKNDFELNELFYDLVDEIYQVNKNIIICLYSGGSVDLKPIEHCYKALLYCGLGGTQVNKALGKILAGEISPSGKLSETFLLSKYDSYAKKGNFFFEKYNEGTLIGYKYYLTNNIPVLYEFGFGLSYTKFDYSNLRLIKDSEGSYIVKFDIKNTGDFDGHCVSEIYISNRERMVETPKKMLVAFSKDFIRRNESKEVEIKIEKDNFAYFSTILNDFYIEDGIYTIYVSTSLTCDELTAKIEIKENGNFSYSRY